MKKQDLLEGKMCFSIFSIYIITLVSFHEHNTLNQNETKLCGATQLHLDMYTMS